MVFDMEHADNAHLIPEVVNSESGNYMHTFKWITDTHKIGSVNEKWNFIPNHSEKNTGNIGAVHYTEGGPNFPHLRQCRYAQIWWDAYQDYLQSKVKLIKFDAESILDGI